MTSGTHGKKVRDPVNLWRDANVWHCSVSLHVDEGQLTDDKRARSPSSSWQPVRPLPSQLGGCPSRCLQQRQRSQPHRGLRRA
ncbi:hypothetical protein [Rhodococcus sp. NCIMB 12038]|uniref:hypothetical protein n=1 Tax=Rhodococcus sp. NCIMB 12038 TaxID=933800 RepID=UPI001179C69F|nr:hypothetical protein [Rhodococcus sp. NCIMB 12038]